MVRIACNAIVLLLFPSLGASTVVDFSNATSISTADADSSDQPDGYSVDIAVDTMASPSLIGIAPEKGDAVPDFARTFPGCSCEWNDQSFKAGYSCENDILAPESMAGKTCCCCTTDCLSEHRCSNDECLLLGVDQAAAVEAERLAAEKAAKEAAIPLSAFGDAKAVIVRLPAGYCTTSGIMQACRKQKMWPLCLSHSQWAQMGRGKPGCRAPRNGWNSCDNNVNCWWFTGRDHPNHKFAHASFEGADNLRKMGLNPLKFGGKCFYASNGGTNQGIANNGWSGGVWSPNSAKQNSAMKIKTMNGEWDGHEQGRKGWETFCVDKKPSPYPRGGFN